MQQFVVTLNQLRQNSELVQVVSKAFEKLSKASHLTFRLTFVPGTNTFNVSFPENTNINAALNVPIDLAFRLGYGFITQITKDSVSQAKPDSFDANNTASRARALVYDTLQVIVTMDNTSDNLNSVTDDICVATLYPTHQGSLEMLRLGFRHQPTMVKLPSYASGSNLIPVSFQLSRFNDDESLIPFQWKTGAYVSGTLRGVNELSLDDSLRNVTNKEKNH
jgi:hypothetical protein